MDVMVYAQQAVADNHADTATGQIVVPLVDANWGEDEPAPRIVCEDVGADLELTAEDIFNLMRAGALIGDPELWAWMRDRYRLPDIDEAYLPQPATEDPTTTTRRRCMTDSTPRYRYWGSHKPAGVGVVTAKAGKTATMKIYDPIDDWGAPFGVSAKEFGAALDELDSDVETIELHVHSPGGIAWEGVAIMNLLRQHPAKVHAVVDGMAASAASYIVVGGADRVTMAPNATLMIHDASGLCVGQAADMKVMFDRLEMLSQNIAEIYAEKAGGSVDDWRSAMQPETWYTADEAVSAGLADDKLKKATADAPTDRFDLSIFAHAGRDHAPAPFMPAARGPTSPRPSRRRSTPTRRRPSR
jgi:ATP-dependent Clp endopeptidase proteolytic subunit ClpP